MSSSKLENDTRYSSLPLPTLNFEVEGLLMPPDGPTAADKAAYDELLGMFDTRAAFYGVA